MLAYSMKYLHILLIILFTGLFVANYYYVTINAKKSNPDNELLVYALRFSFYIDIILSIGFLFIPITCIKLIILGQFSFVTPWLVSAYLLFSMTSILWGGLLWIKIRNYRAFSQSNPMVSSPFNGLNIFHGLYILAIVCLVLTVHDAVFKHTLFSISAISIKDSLFLWLKTIHFMSACLLFGTGFGTALYMFSVNYSGNISFIAKATSQVVVADWLFTTSSGVMQALTGLAMVYLKGYSLLDSWILLAIIGYVFAGLCWLIVVWLQIKCRNISHAAKNNKNPLPKQYYRFFYAWCLLGLLAFPTLLFVIYLMVNGRFF